MISSHPPSLQLLWNTLNFQDSTSSLSLFLFQLHLFFIFFLLWLTPLHPSTHSEMWADNEDPLPAVTSLLRATKNRTSSVSTPQFFARSTAFQQCRRRCAVNSATRMQATCRALRSAAYIFGFSDGGRNERFAWRQSLRAPLNGFPLTCPPAPLSFLTTREIIAKRTTNEQVNRDLTLVVVFFLWDFTSLLEEFYVRNVEGYGLNNGCVTDSWSKVSHLSFFYQLLSTLVETHLNGRIPERLSLIPQSRKMWIKRSVARR